MMAWRLYLPVLLFAALAVLFYFSLGRDTEHLDSPLLGRAMPVFVLPDIDGIERSAADLRGEPMLLNVWATWCVACRVEHPFLLRIAEEYAVPVIGLSYKDEAGLARQWLQDLGNPFRFSIDDRQGRLGLELGVYGAPETYLLDAEGIIRYKHVGVIDARIWQDRLWPQLQRLRGEGS